MIGRITSNKQIKTATVLVERTKTDRLYHKSYTRGKKYSVDDQIGVKIGDLVEIVKVAPVSKTKHWRIVKVVGRNIEEVVSEQLQQAAEELVAEVMPEEKIEESSDVSPQIEEKSKAPRKRKEKSDS